ncbi:type IV toxin-antitoxin system AbiEi family antitoxin domain-containing protein [Fodinibacter luteus]|uniref:Type IV toxin-antitoxin system AbiEi family antitoxin domain-containing protein n=1 Tax=Fodinibacter luteus TaxID=552064 RepID=A0ABP8KNW1_9MICO
MDRTWQEAAENRCGVLSEATLRELKVTRGFVRNQVRAGRWTERTHSVYTTTTGPPSREQLLWIALEHAGPDALLGGLTAAEAHGLRNWSREEVTVVVDHALSFDPIDGVRFFRTRRDLAALRHPGRTLRTCRIEPAVLIFAGDEASQRTAMGAIAATVQQRLTTPERLLAWTRALRPLRRAADIRGLLADLSGGSQSLAEVDVLRTCRSWGIVPPCRQKRRTDRSGRFRYTDCEWDLPDGRVLVLEIDGAFHLDVESYSEDVRRQRRLTTPTRVIVRCTAQEVRHEPLELLSDLVALGVPRAA